MNNIYREIFDNIDIGVAIVDRDFCILVWNNWLENVSKKKSEEVVGKKITDTFSIFNRQMYRSILSECIERGQSRFCSGVLHKAFIYPVNEDLKGKTIRQNMQVTPLVLGDRHYILIQIFDLTTQHERVNRLKDAIKELEDEQTSLKEHEVSLTDRLKRDFITGFPNRILFTKLLNDELVKTYVGDLKACIIYLKIQHLVGMKKELSFTELDELTKLLGGKIENILKSNDNITRVDRDFILFLPSITNIDEIAEFTENLSKKISFCWGNDRGKYIITPSIGMSIYPDDAKSASDLIKNAEMACSSVIEGDEDENVAYYNKMFGALSKANMALRESKSKYRLLFENMDEGFSYNKILLNEKGEPADFVILDANEAFAKILGITKEDVIGKQLIDMPMLVSDQDVDYKKFFEKVALGGETMKIDEMYISSLELWLSLSAYNLGRGYFTTIISDITSRKETEELITKLAYFDNLTGLPNRKMFFDRIEMIIAKAKRQHLKFALLYMDFNNFKAINDNLGHDIGDKVLKRGAEIFKSLVRECDTVARIGGDEFVIIQDLIDSHEDIMALVNRIGEEFDITYPYKDDVLHVTCSIGVSVYPDDGIYYDTLLNRADKAMYYAKHESDKHYAFISELEE